MAVVVISRLPADVTPDDITSFLREQGYSGDIGNIRIDAASGQPLAWVQLDISNAAATAVSAQLNGRVWKGQTLACTETLLFK
ncbi:RNA-binding protein [Andreprevotia chitinilytica]|uniref:RNA-binding protein n=1 Tax=Andreprevotia chitinilytica TaxID=396808 RepID=UPI000550EE17|nr:RNA-binding protein [Andreprevotia chitinilytica]